MLPYAVPCTLRPECRGVGGGRGWGGSKGMGTAGACLPDALAALRCAAQLGSTALAITELERAVALEVTDLNGYLQRLDALAMLDKLASCQ